MAKKTKEESLEEVRRNRLNDLCMSGIGYIGDTADVIDLGIAEFLTKYGDDRDMMLKVYAVLNKATDKEENREHRGVGYYVAWIFTEDDKDTHTWASFGWYRESLWEVYELGDAIKKLNLKTYSEYRDI